MQRTSQFYSQLTFVSSYGNIVFRFLLWQKSSNDTGKQAKNESLFFYHLKARRQSDCNTLTALIIPTYSEVNMTNRSVAAAPLSHNDVVVLGKLFEISVNFFRTHQSPNAQDFILELRTIAGLGLTASLVDNGGLMPYQIYFNRFVHAEQGDFLKDQSHHTSLWGKTMANMVAISLDSFRRTNYPNYYADFRESIRKTIQNVRVTQEGGDDNAKGILDLLPLPARRSLL